MTLVPAALAAELALFAFLGAGENPDPLGTARPILDDTVTSMLSAAHTEIDTGEVAPATPVVKPKTPASDSVNRGDTTVASQTVAVTPRAGQKYGVIRTADPRVSIVWPTKGDTL
jgi:hypothetical protein